ncbi:MAG: putative Ig domain-containing protein [Candidatus Marinimicrobia bacterium]|nr:putative Ig domain-containing protein [Candidatus Neomarinimicrobiota bacterium]
MSKHFFSHVMLRYILLAPLIVALSITSLFGAGNLRDIHHVTDLGDLNHDGNNDFGAIRKGNGSNTELIGFSVNPDGDFDIFWRFALPENLIGEWVDFTLADLNLNGRPELVAIMKLVSAGSGSNAPWLYGFEWTGSEFEYIPSFQWAWKSESGLFARPGQIEVADIDRDGLSELFITLSAPQVNLLVLEFNGDLKTAEVEIEYSGLPSSMTKIPASISIAVADVNADNNDDIILMQKQGSQVMTAGIVSMAEDKYSHQALPTFTLNARDEVIHNSTISKADLGGRGSNLVYIGSSGGTIYQYDPTIGGSVWQRFSSPINTLSFSDMNGNGLTEGLIQSGDRIYFLEQATNGVGFDCFHSLVDATISGQDVLAFRDGLLIKNHGVYQFMAVGESAPHMTEDMEEMEEATEEITEEAAEEPMQAEPPLLDKLVSEPAETTMISEPQRKPKAPDIILHVNESFVHNIPRQDDMDPGQAYVKFRTYPEGMRLGKDFVLRWNPTEDQLGYHQISYSFGQSLDTSITVYVNHPPDIFSTPPPLAQTGQQYLYQVQWEDLNTEQYSEFELISAPSGMAVDEEGLVRWLPSDTQLDSQYVTLSISDGFERTLQKFALYVNILPLVLDKPAPVAFVNEPYVGQIGIQDKNEPNTARVIPLRAPQNLVLESSGRITWTPEERQTGFHDVLFELTDDMSTSLDSFTLFANTPPIISSRYEKHVPVGKPWNYNVEVQDPNANQDIGFLISESSIPNLTISRRGRITWTPTEAELGRQTFTVSVSDGLRDDLQKVDIYVNSPPVLGKVTDTLAIVARPFTTTVPVTDHNKGQALNYTFLSAPDGMTISNAGQIEWTPTRGQKGWNEVFVKVSDEYASDTYKFAVYANAPPIIVSTPDTLAIAGQEYVYELKALDLNTDQTLVFEVLNAPEGVSIRNNSAVVWTPTLDQLDKAQFKVSVTDGHDTNVQTVDLFVNALPEVTSKPSAVVLADRKYRYQLKSRDLNKDSITYSTVLLPSGADMDTEEGLITWTPDKSNEGANKFIIQLTDSRGSTNLHEFEVNVFEDPKTPMRQMGAFIITLAGIGAMFILKFLS